MKTVNSRRIKEALNLQELTPEEKEKRGILGRLYGPCASIAIPTRNGRFYDESIWDDQFNNNDILKELISNGGCPMELDHPVDREETDSTKIAAMMSTLPKKDENGNLICYCDIIDTPCGRIAYQLAKYGFKLGISSRATGDTYTRPDGTEGINPDTFQLTTFDLVLVPALANARLTLTESLTPRKKKLIESLSKEYNKANEDEKKIMSEELNKLNIKLNEALDIEEKEPETFKEFVAGQNIDEIKEASKSDEEVRAENKEALDAINTKLDNLTDALSKVIDAKAEESKEEVESSEVEEPAETENEEVSKLSKIDVPEEEESKAEQVEEPAEENESPKSTESEDKAEAEKPAEDKEEVEEKESEPVNNDVEGSDEEEKDSTESTSNEKVITDEEKSSDDNNIDKKESEHLDSEKESVENVEEDEDLEKIKESLLKKYEQQESLEDTKSKLAVSEAKVKWLEEELSRYKSNSINLSRLARSSKTLKKDNLRLEEELSKSKELLNSSLKENKSLRESIDQESEGIYQEAYEKCSKVLEEVKNKLLSKNEKIKSLEEELDKSKQNIKNLSSEKADLQSEKEELIEKYINLKSSSLGISRKTINESLNSKSIKEIDTVCDKLNDRQQRLGSLPFELNEGVKIKYKKPVKAFKNDDDYIDEDSFDQIAKLK